MRRMASAAAAKKWPRLFQCWRLARVADQPQVGLVDQGGGLERLARLLLGQPLRRQLAQLVVDQRQQLLGGVRVALLDGVEHLGDRVHRQAPRAVPIARAAEAPLPEGRTRRMRAGVASGATVRRASPRRPGQKNAPLRTRDVRRFRRAALGKRKAPGMKSRIILAADGRKGK